VATLIKLHSFVSVSVPSLHWSGYVVSTSASDWLERQQNDL